MSSPCIATASPIFSGDHKNVHDIQSIRTPQDDDNNIIRVQDCDRSHAGSSVYAYFNILCCICGVGMLGLPQSLQKGGWSALLLLILSWWMTLYCSIILIRSLYLSRCHDNQKIPLRLVSMPAIAKEAFGKVGGYITFFFQTLITFGLATLHFILAGANMNKLCEGTVAQIGQVSWTIVICILVAFPYIFLKSMKDTGWTSIFGALAILTTAVICVIVAGIDQQTRYSHQEEHPENTMLPAITHHTILWQTYPAALSNISVSFSGNVTFPTIEAAMNKPHQWSRVITTGLSTAALFYIMIATAGYSIYGDTVQNPVYYSLPEGIPRIVCTVLITIAVTASIPIYLMALTLECEEMMGITVERRGRFYEFILRAGFRSFTVFLCGLIGCTVPYFDLLMALFGAFGCSTTVYLIPVLCYWRLSGFRNKPFYELAWNFLILVFGLMGLVFGTWFAMEDLIRAYQHV
ncbi:transmembrane amino acid transporter protein-domain-containing protein [Phascolomyces articulosus]|uniref:Transmembrane amino acid transporter protein-domain-containing protein n=1 Tax=Phascolomyces articulosus TaxID=60185 RepID=A0AAD5JML0_9FUNG|nr:transmembrane amino acid transporter protein-domain-containing protein [Phascolomyces articulosus]